MNLTSWYKKRGTSFIIARARRLNERYGLGPRKAMARIESCVNALRGYECFPTFAVPGMVVERNLPFIRRLQEMGAEIAVHGYNHVDLKACPPEEGRRQLLRAAEVFRAGGLEAHGFRCPYLSASADLLRAIPAGAFQYSSNQAIQWPYSPGAGYSEGLLFDTIQDFYMPRKWDESLSLPWFQDGLVEIPVSVPDDLQMHDGLGYGLGQVAQVWLDILRQTYRYGEVFNLMFHPELASFVEAPFRAVLEEARSLMPRVWTARLREVGAWWKEKAAFRVEIELAGEHPFARFHCTPRATILCKGFAEEVPGGPWDADYRRLYTHALRLDGPALPFVGLPPDTPPETVERLREMGYILEMGEDARRCGLYLEDADRLTNPRDLVDAIEDSGAPIVRFWPWPDGARSALCITGDLDALSWQDYAARLLKR